MQRAFTGVTATGKPVTYLAPQNIAGSVTISFSPTTVNSWLLAPDSLAAVQSGLGGPGGYVTEWMCIMTPNSAIPSGIPPASTAMNLGWYGVPTVVPIGHPAGKVLSPRRPRRRWEPRSRVIAGCTTSRPRRSPLPGRHWRPEG